MKRYHMVEEEGSTDLSSAGIVTDVREVPTWPSDGGTAGIHRNEVEG